MAVSPVVTRSPSGTDSATGGTATHAKILAMRNSGRVEQRPASQPTPASELGGSLAVIPEPAEQLNAAISRKYIKGGFCLPCIYISYWVLPFYPFSS